MSRRVLATLTCSVVLAAGAAGCGGDKKGDATSHDTPSSTATDGSASAPGLTESDFKEQANAICKAGNADIKKIGGAFAPGAGNAEMTAALTKAANRDDQAIADIRKLAVPDSISADVTAFLDAVNAATAKIRDQGVKVLSAADPFTDADAKAKALGLDDCVSSAGT